MASQVVKNKKSRYNQDMLQQVDELLSKERLNSLIYPLKVEDFLSNVWPNNVHFSTQGGVLLSELIKQPEFNDINSLVNMPFKGISRANFNGQNISPKKNLNTKQLIKAYELLDATIYLQELQTKMIRSWNNSLDLALSLSPGTARMGCFISPKGKGHKWHYDPHETIIVQVRGTKRWHLASNHWPKGIGLNHDRALERDKWANYDKSTLKEPSEYQAYDMNPGSVLYVPYGHWHTVENITDSLHLVLNVSRSYLLTGTLP